MLLNSTMPTITLATKNRPAQEVNSTEVEKPGLKGTR